MGHRAWIMGALGLMLTLAYTFLQIGSEEVPTWAMMIGGFGISLMLIFVGIERKTIVTQLSGQQNRNNLLAVGLVLILTGIAIGINVIAYQLDERWDLTSDQSFSLSPQTIAYLESIDEPVEVLAFFPDQSEEERYFRDLSATMSAHTDRLEVQVLDPIRQPSKAREYDITDMGVVLQKGERQIQVASPYSEASFRLALINLLSEETHYVCFSTGHGEPSIEDPEHPDNYGQLSWSLEDQNYFPIAVDLAQVAEVPSECSVFVATSTSRGWSESDMGALQRFALRGGDILAFLAIPDSNIEDELSAFNQGLHDLGIWVGAHPIEEFSEQFLVPGETTSTFITTPVQNYDHAITRVIEGALVYAWTPPLDTTLADGVDFHPLVESSGSTRSLDFDEAGIMPVSVVAEITDAQAVARDIQLDQIEGIANGGQIVVLGSQAMASNSWILRGNGWNADLVLNAIAWLAEENIQIQSRYRTDAPAPPLLTEQDIKMVRNIVLLFVPGLALMAALGMWRQRRRL